MEKYHGSYNPSNPFRRKTIMANSNILINIKIKYKNRQNFLNVII